MAEAGVPIRVTMNFAGHMTQRMQQRYEAISMTAKRDWGEIVWGTLAGRSAVARENVQAADAWPRRKPIGAERSGDRRARPA
jgi:hypothetical protein